MAEQKQVEGESETESAEEEELELEESAQEEETEGGDAEEAPDEFEVLREELEEAKAQAAGYLDGWQRAQAEFSNYKKRQGVERAQMMVMASANLLRKLLPVVDDFERAAETLPEGLEQETWLEGILIVKHKLGLLLESEGVEPIESDGQVFDPRYHEAVTYEQAEGYEEGQIIGQVQRGYMLGGRVLRPALVRVAQAPVAQLDEDNVAEVGGKE